MHTKSFLETLKNRPRDEDEDIGSYCRQFAAISKRLMRKGKLDAYTKRQWFLQGLFIPIQNEMCYRVELQQKQVTLLSFDDLLENVFFMVKAKPRLTDMVRPSGSSERMTKLVEKRFYKSSGKYVSPTEKTISKKVSFIPDPTHITEIATPKDLITERGYQNESWSDLVEYLGSNRTV